MATIYLSIGSNIERDSNICRCLATLKQDFPDIRFSTVYETPAVGFNGDAFLNLVAVASTPLSVQAMQLYLRTLEDKHGRVRGGDKFAARSLDVDLLLYDDLNLQPEFNLPHADIQHYPFVLLPLLELTPDLTHPVTGQALKTLLLTVTPLATALQSYHLNCT